MATEFAMPKLGLTMESGTILRWLVADGAQVTVGQAVLLVETDKVETEIEASGSGVLAQTGELGEEYACGVRIGWFLEAGETAPPEPELTTAAAGAATGAVLQASPQTVAAGAARAPGEHTSGSSATATPQRAPGGRVLASPAAKRLARELDVNLSAVAGSGANGRITERDVRAAADAGQPSVPTGPIGAAAAAGGPAPDGTVPPPATLAGRQLADLLGLDLRTVRASAADGRISRTDVAAHVRTLLAGLSPSVDPAAPRTDPPAASDAPGVPQEMHPLTQAPAELIALRGMRGVIAERMSASLRSMAQLTLTMDVDMSAVVAERSALAAAARRDDTDTAGTAGDADGGAEPSNDGEDERAAVVPGYTDYVVAAAAAALREHPRVNSQVTADAVALLPDIHVGLAVALDDGLLVPVIRHADRLSLGEIAAETNRLALRAREGGLNLDDFQGGTFAVTALGMFGVDAFTPVINPPNTAILGVGRIRTDTAWTADDGPTARPVLTLSLTWDHRAFDGAPAARFAGAVRDWIENRGAGREQ